MMLTPFTEEDAYRAYNEWGANCGPGAVAAIMGMSLDEVRPIMAAEAHHARNSGREIQSENYTNDFQLYRRSRCRAFTHRS